MASRKMGALALVRTDTPHRRGTRAIHPLMDILTDLHKASVFAYFFALFWGLFDALILDLVVWEFFVFLFCFVLSFLRLSYVLLLGLRMIILFNMTKIFP